MEMARQEFAIGDYIDFKQGAMQVSEQSRRHMITLIEDIHSAKGYKEETLYLAMSLADRFLVSLAVQGSVAPCLIRLSVICILMAAKLE